MLKSVSQLQSTNQAAAACMKLQLAQLLPAAGTKGALLAGLQVAQQKKAQLSADGDGVAGWQATPVLLFVTLLNDDGYTAALTWHANADRNQCVLWMRLAAACVRILLVCCVVLWLGM